MQNYYGGNNIPNENADNNIRDTYNSSRKAFRQNLFFWLVIIVAFILIPQLNIFGDKTDSALVFDEEGFTITYPNEEATSCRILFSDVEKIEYCESFDYGNAIDGDINGKCAYGVWENSALGSYNRCSSTKVTGCITIFCNEEWYVINYESDDTTEELYNAMLREMDALGISHN